MKQGIRRRAVGTHVGSPVDFTCQLPFGIIGKIEKMTIKLGQTDIALPKKITAKT